MQRINKIGVLQTAKVAAIIYFLIMAVFMIPMSIFSTFIGVGPLRDMPIGGGIMWLFMPFIYGAVAFIFTAIGCFVYNLVSGWIGGIEIELGEDPNPNMFRQTE